ncbi:MAG TPA: urate hydroxylase PuuD [Candidatus Thermoplasmatota archaeon]|nr:urate hydroxylase PuuD [Candidatus Thermoplasmatota archaeon]
MDLNSAAMILLRWLHFVAAITWIGLLYFFNLVNVPWQKALDGATKGKVVATLMPRALWWFRWGATITVVAGILLLAAMMNEATSARAFFETGQGRIIAVGGLLGLVMWFNVWFIIWPNQRRIIAAMENTAKTGAAAPTDQPKWARQAFLASRTNFVLSMPMLAMMASSSHLGVFRDALYVGLATTVVALVWVWYLGQPKKTTTPPPAAAPTTPTPSGGPANPPTMGTNPPH